jgi:hypothetical protein
LISSVFGISGIDAVFIIANRISRLISIRGESCKNQDAHHLKKNSLKTDDEISDVINSL